VTIRLGEVLAEAGALWRGEKLLVRPIAGLFLFLPTLALLLLLPQPEAVDAASDPEGAAVYQAMLAYARDNAPALIGANLLQLFGSATILMLFLGRPRPVVGEALKRTVAAMPVLVLAMLSVWVLTFFGALLILPAMYLIGRSFLVSSAIVAEGPMGPVQAIARSFALTKGAGWLLFSVAALLFLGGQALGGVAGGMDRAAQAAGGGGSLMLPAFFNAIAAFATTAATVATLLVKVAVYRRASSGI
jgi:hypothetical protein